MHHSGLSRRAFLGTSGAGAVVAGAGTLIGTAGVARANAQPGPGGTQVFVNNVGYEHAGPKRFVIGAADGSGPMPFQVIDMIGGNVVMRGSADFAGPVADWQQSNPQVPAAYWTGDFTGLRRQGQYVIVAGDGTSYPFLIEKNLYERHTMNHVTHYFKGSRCSGLFDKKDRNLPIGQNGKKTVDVHGGWYDATADLGIHFNQVFTGPTAPFLVTTQSPLAAWVQFASARQLKRRWTSEFTQLHYWLLDEGMYGADWLVRMQPAGGSFYSSINQPEPGNTGYDPEDPSWRFLDTTGNAPTLVSFRGGGGSAVAALAMASTYKQTGEYDSKDYLNAAVRAYDYMRAHNYALNLKTPDNISDDSEILLASSELYRATHHPAYLAVARKRAASLADRVTRQGYLRADNGTRPYFHPSNAGLPMVSLLSYIDLASPAERAHLLDAARRALAFEIATTGDTVNPFGYARQYVQIANGSRFDTFFYPHDVSPSACGAACGQSGGWFQGENARLASLAAAARLLHLHTGDPALEQYAVDQLNWICGLNPYAVCMLGGVGLNNPQYYDVAGTWQFLPIAGGINNGICGLTLEGRGIQYSPNYRDDGFKSTWQDDWRLNEQWLPHASWFLLATAVS